LKGRIVIAVAFVEGPLGRWRQLSQSVVHLACDLGLTEGRASQDALEIGKKC
jgi:hypothetical protein